MQLPVSPVEQAELELIEAWKEYLQQQEVEKWIQSTPPFEPLRVFPPKGGLKQVRRELHEKYVEDRKAQ